MRTTATSVRRKVAFDVPRVPEDALSLATALDLRVRVYRYGEIDVWMVTDVRTRRELGSWVPSTGRLRVGGFRTGGVTRVGRMLRLFDGRRTPTRGT